MQNVQKIRPNNGRILFILAVFVPKLAVFNLIPQADRDGFFQDVQEDLQELSPSRIAGLGVSLAELMTWINDSKTKNI